MGQLTFSKGEKKKCKYYNFGKCKIQAHGKDCQPHTKDGAVPEYIEGCSEFVPIEAGEDRNISCSYCGRDTKGIGVCSFCEEVINREQQLVKEGRIK